jgi:hypothetical protein
MGFSVEVDRMATEGKNFMPDPFVSDHEEADACGHGHGGSGCLCPGRLRSTSPPI